MAAACSWRRTGAPCRSPGRRRQPVRAARRRGAGVRAHARLVIARGPRPRCCGSVPRSVTPTAPRPAIDPDGTRFGIEAAGPSGGRTAVRALDIPADTFHGAYNAVANATLWFVHHLLFEIPVEPRFGPTFRRDWQSYVAYNEAFARALAAGASAGAGGRPGARAGLPSVARPADAPRYGAGHPDRALLPYAVGTGGLLPDTSGRHWPCRPGRHPGRGSRGLSVPAMGRRLPRLL